MNDINEKISRRKFTRFVYLSSSTLMDRSANSVHVAKMSDAIAKKGIPVDLFTYNHFKLDKAVNFEYEIYNVNLSYYKFDRVRSRVLKLFASFIEIFSIKNNYNERVFYYGRNLLLLYLLKKFFKFTVVAEIHAMAFSRIGMFLYGFFLPSFDCLVVITESLKLDLTSKYNLSDETFLVLPDAADFKEYKPQQIMHNSKLTIGYVGSFYSGRGINLILEMAKRLSEYQFVLVGATDDFINKNFEFLNLKNLEIIKYVPNSMLGVYYDKFDIVVAPYERIIKSKEKAPDTSKWASPLKIFEYMSYSKCILASNLPVFGEVLIDGHNCILCEPNNLIDWIDKIRLLEKSPDLRSNLARNAYQDFNQNYTWDIRAKKLLDHLNKLEIVFK